jgi:hypothetical protein
MKTMSAVLKLLVRRKTMANRKRATLNEVDMAIIGCAERAGGAVDGSPISAV